MLVEEGLGGVDTVAQNPQVAKTVHREGIGGGGNAAEQRDRLDGVAVPGGSHDDRLATFGHQLRHDGVFVAD